MNVAKKVFSKLGEAERNEWETRSKLSAEARKSAYELIQKTGFPTDPHWRKRRVSTFLLSIITDRRVRAIDDIKKVVLPFLIKVFEMTGFHAFCILGGLDAGQPEDDPIGTIVLQVGRNSHSVVAQPFSAKEPRALSDFVKVYRQYLTTCFSQQDREAARITGPDPLIATQEDVLAAAKYTLDGKQPVVFGPYRADPRKGKGRATASSSASKRSRAASTSSVDQSASPSLPNTGSPGRPKAKRRRRSSSPLGGDVADDEDEDGMLLDVPIRARLSRQAELAKKATATVVLEEEKQRQALEDQQKAAEATKQRQIEKSRREVKALKAQALTPEAREAARLKAEKEKRIQEDGEARMRARQDHVWLQLNDRLVRSEREKAAARRAAPATVDAASTNAMSGNEDEHDIPPRSPTVHTTDDDLPAPETIDVDNVPKSPAIAADKPPTVTSRSKARAKSKPKAKATAAEVPVWVDQPFEVAMPPNAPVWLQQTLTEFARHDLGPDFRDVVQALAELEETYGFASGGKLPMDGRLEQFVMWFRDGRKWVGTHEGIRFQNNISDFAASFGRWWAKMQPAWRSKDAAGN
uniref:Uncharacterized protein n=1 Tax=Mycena chlorophos TaxID=658473 RepID=A0ABQ0M4J0_MYCCL|nr:predicted protein [Mycena chlorophos]